SSSLQVGDEVVVHPGLSCRTCDFCVTGQEFFCRQFRIWGFQSGPNDGGHSEYVTMPAVNVLPKPANLSHEEAASMPLVLETACRMFGANPIPVVGGAQKVAKAEQLGAVNVIDRSSQDVLAEVKAITGKAGADIVFEH